MAEESSLRLRPASLSDLDFLLAIRNDSTTRSMSDTSTYTVSSSEYGDQLGWKLTDPLIHLYVAEADHQPVGTATLERQPGPHQIDGLISYAVHPDHRGRGYGTAILRALKSEAARLGIDRLRGDVKAVNGPSLAAFRSAGFGEPGMVVFELSIASLRSGAEAALPESRAA